MNNERSLQNFFAIEKGLLVTAIQLSQVLETLPEEP